MLAGGADDVWIFQIGSTLDLSTGAKVVLGGGARPKNVYWQVAAATTLGTSSQMRGVLLDATSIAMMTGATLDGRALAKTATTMDANAVRS